MTTKEFNKLFKLLQTDLTADEDESVTANNIFNKIHEYSDDYLRKGILVTEEERKRLYDMLTKALWVEWKPPIGIFDKTTRLNPWFNEEVPAEQQYYWNRYKAYLIAKGWENKIETLNNLSTTIVNQLGNPRNTQSQWQRHGLVIGEVQSGKTANYTAIINKAADAGYNVIIVLAGIAESLRIQTQIRLDKEFAGRKTGKDLGTKKKFVPLGSGNFCDKKCLRTPANCTSESNDFNAALMGNGFSINGLKEPCYFVTKKNAKILDNIFDWLNTNNFKLGETIDQSILIIDDEADNASINFKKEEDPATINRCIRKILSLFSRSSYLAITATPFANIFIDPEGFHDKYGDDLFPKDYMFLINKPSDYLGVSEIFGDDKKVDWLIPINEEEIEGSAEEPGILPLSHKKDDELLDLPEDLYEALRYYLVCNAVLDKENSNLLHRSMLINISRFVKKHQEIESFVAEWLIQVKADFSNYSALSETCSTNPKYGELFYCHEVFNKYFGEKDESFWNDLCEKGGFSKSISSVGVVSVNQNKASKDVLNFEAATKRNESTRYIFIGGFALGRGLTLEGLIVSYVYRRATCYDVLLQMGRWFGYRPGYEKYVKIWMSESMMDSFFDLSEIVLPDLYHQIEVMNQTDLSPENFGFMIRSNLGTLEITARNKMKNSKNFSIPCKVDGYLIEAPKLINDETKIKKNNSLVYSFIAKNLLNRERSKPEYGNEKFYWKGIPGYLIADLIKEYKAHPWQLSFQGDSLADYIIQNNINDWDVYIDSKQNNTKDDVTPIQLFNNEEVIPMKRKLVVDTSAKNLIRVSGSKVKIGSGEVTRVGLTEEQYKKVKAEHKDKRGMNESWLLEVPGRKSILILYPIQPDPKIEGIPSFIWGIGIGFAGKASDNTTCSYKVNLVKYEELSDMLEQYEGEHEYIE